MDNTSEKHGQANIMFLHAHFRHSETSVPAVGDNDVRVKTSFWALVQSDLRRIVNSVVTRSVSINKDGLKSVLFK